MNTSKHLLLENDGTNRIKFDFDFDYNYENDNNKEGTHCRNCGKHEYRNGEFKTIKMGDNIFTHITHFRTPGEDLCAQCDTITESSSTKKDQHDIKPFLHTNANSKNTPNGKSSSTITNNNNNNIIMNNNNNTVTSKIHIGDSDISSATNLNSNLNLTMGDRNNSPHNLESQQQLQLQGNHPQSIPVTVPIITPNNLSTTNNNTLISFDGSSNNNGEKISIKSETPVIAMSIGHNSNNNNNNNITNTNSNQENILSHSQFSSNCSQNPTNNLNLNESTYTFSMTNSSSSLHEASSSSSIPAQGVGVELPMTFIISHPQLQQHEQSSSSPLSSSSNPTNTNNNSTLLDTATTTTTTTSTFVSNTLQSPQQQQQLPGIISDLGNTSNSNGPSTIGILSGIPTPSSITTTTNSTSTTTTNITTNNSKKFVCKTCGKEFLNKKTKNLHIQRVHEKLERYFCHICTCKFAYRGSLDSHLASHITPEITHDCTKCPRKFKEKSNLTNHMKIHSDNPKKFCCEFCPSQFSKRVNLRYHCKRKHPDEYMNSSAFATPNNTHITSATSSQSQQQSNNNNMSYNIPMSSPSGGFNSTATKDTPNNNNNNNNKEKPPGNFSCEHCGRTFLFKNNLKAHLRVHTKDKKYTCDICEKSFIYKESLKNHMLLHTQELPYECHICQKKFRDRSNRRKHVKNVHKFLFLNGEDGTGSPTGGGAGTAVKNGTSPQGKPNDNNNTTTPAKKRRNNNKKNSNDAQDTTTSTSNKTPSGNNRKKSANNNNTKANNSNPRNNNNKSVIVSTPNSNVMLDQDRKIIMSPKNPMSPLEYSHLPVTVHVPAAGGGLHQHYISTANRNHNVIVKAGSVPSSSSTTNIASPQSDLDLYHRSQNVIVYPKSKGNDNYMEPNSHNNLLPSSSHLAHSQSSQQQQQQQYYRVEESFDTRQNPQPTYMTLPISSPQSNSQPPPNLTYDFVPNSSQEPVPIKIEQDHSHNNSNSSNNPNIQNTIRFGSEEHESIQQYSTPMYIHSDPHQQQQHHQYWTIASPNNPPGVPISTNVSLPYSTSSTTNVSYVSPITAASNVLNNAPHPYGSDIHQHQHPTPGDQPHNTYYNYDLSKFDFSFL